MHPRCLFPLLVLAVFLAQPFPARGAEDEPPREATPPKGATIPRRCGVCHLERVDAADRQRFNFLTLRQPDGAGQSGMCYSCHNGPVRDSRRAVWTGRQHRAEGDEIERGPGRRASCGTCHDPHVQTEGISTFMRFTKSFAGHCQECHPGRKGGNRGEHPSVGGRSPSKVLSRANCGTCHRVHGASGSSLITATSAARLCDTCHSENPSRKGEGSGMESHPVGGDGPGCSSCHMAHRSSSENLVKQGALDTTICQGCHKNRVSQKGGQGNHPLRPDSVGCLSCHRVHNAAALGSRRALLAVPSNALDRVCRQCHTPLADAQGEWNHPVGRAIENATTSRLSKLIGYGGLLGEGKKVLCLSCHRSHNALKGTANLLVIQQALCLYCHTDQNSLAPQTARFGTHPVSVKPSKAKIAESFLQAGGEQGRSGEIICTTCHRIHHAKAGTAGLVLSQEEYACSECHTSQAEILETAHGAPAGAPKEEGSTGGAGAPDPCRSCHHEHGWSIPFEKVSMGGSVIEKVCWYCHGPEGSTPMSGYFGHIVGVPPSGGTGGRDLPLFWEDGRRLERGLTTCATCHDPHRDPVRHFLRLNPDETAADLCLGCHRQKEAVVGTKHDLALYFPGEQNRRGESASRTGPCGACHLIHSGGPGESWAREVVMDPGQPAQMGIFCEDCHREGSFAQGKVVTERGHPSLDTLNERPETVIVDCNGCHNPHVWNPTDPSDKGKDFFTAGDGTNSFLVTPSGSTSQLCRRCHDDQFEVAGTRHDFSPGGVGEGGKARPAKGPCEGCHLSHGGDPFLMWTEPLPEEKDYGSVTCLSCHSKGKMASDSALDGFNHPIGMNPGPDTGEELPLYMPSGQEYYRGKVSCGTCHDPHRWFPEEMQEGDKSSPPGATTSFLRLFADGYSPLCFPCHANRSMVVGTDHDLRVTAPEVANLDGLVTDESGVCGSCHSVHGSTHQLSLWNRKLGKGEDPQSQYCRSCHDEGGEKEAKVPPRLEVHLVSYPGKGLVSKPFTQRQSSVLDMSSTFTLINREGDRKNRGFLSCGTCHDVHRWESDTNRSGSGTPLEGDSKNSFLRVRNTFSIGRSFCKECHGEDALQYFQQYHFPQDAPQQEP